MEALKIIAGFIGVAMILDLMWNEGDTLKAIFGKRPKK
jgi:hypothetical protein